MIFSKYIAVVCTTILLCAGCGNSAEKTTISIWHFWSEPAQQQVFDSLLRNYELQNPNLNIVGVPLLWGDGKTKIMLAANSSTLPDIVNLSIEWVSEFSEHGMLGTVKANPDFIPAYSTVSPNSKQFAVPWTINTRAFLVSNNSDSLETWAQLEKFVQRYPNSFGVPSDEPFNIAKKILPILWSGGSNAFLSSPISETIDENAITALEYYCRLAKYGVMEKNSILDAYFSQGKISLTMTGMWFANDISVQNKSRDIRVLPHIPVQSTKYSGASILSGDCFAVPKGKLTDDVQKFLDYITSYSVARSFCLALPDAGFPAYKASFTDSVFLRSPFVRGFLQQVSISHPLTTTKYSNEALRIFERWAMEALYGTTTPREALLRAKQTISLLENSEQKP